MANSSGKRGAGRLAASFEAKLGASLERNPTKAPTIDSPPVPAVPASSLSSGVEERKITRVFMEFLPADEEQVRRITKFLVNNERMGVNRMRVVRLALRALAEDAETLHIFDSVLQEDGRTKANRQKRESLRKATSQMV
jgi:hypothetical protein